jgi:hypothetical protein
MIDSYIIGIDPGKTGAIISIEKDGTISSKNVTPLVGTEIDWAAFADLLRPGLTPANNVHVFVEHVHAMHNSSAKATFSFGGCFEGVKALCAAFRLPMTLVSPKDWQKEMHQGIPQQYKPAVRIVTGKKAGQMGKPRKDPKKMSLMAVKRLFPNESLLRTERCSKEHDGIIDALLIAEYGRRRLNA